MKVKYLQKSIEILKRLGSLWIKKQTKKKIRTASKCVFNEKSKECMKNTASQQWHRDIHQDYPCILCYLYKSWAKPTVASSQSLFNIPVNSFQYTFIPKPIQLLVSLHIQLMGFL